MTEYLILKETSAHAFGQLVENILKDGWICQGGVSITHKSNTNEIVYSQAMIRTTKQTSNL